jgi:DNA-directed RNA polymerase specialized sigma24 family protein
MSAKIGTNDFDNAVERLCRHLRGEPRASNADVRVVRAYLERLVRHRFPALTHAAADLGAEALSRFTLAAINGRVDCATTPAAYLQTILVNIARDELAQRAPPSPVVVRPEDLAEQVIDRLFSAEEVRRVIRAAREAGDHLAVRVVVAHWNLVRQLSNSPSLRAVGEEALTSHVTVRRVYQQVAAYLTDSSGDWPPRRESSGC